MPRDNTQNYPICIAGEGACPPDDCGGIPGFEEILATLAHGKASEKKEINRWLKIMQKIITHLTQMNLIQQ